MFPLSFKREKAEYFLNCLAKSRAIDPPQKGWTVDEMAVLAGACFFAISTHGPILRRALAKKQGRDPGVPEHREHKEADGQLVYNDIHAAIEFAGHLIMLLHDGGYEQAFDDSIQCGVTMETAEMRVHPLQGFKTV